MVGKFSIHIPHYELQATSYLRRVQVSSLLYIDDRLIVRYHGGFGFTDGVTDMLRAKSAIYMAVEVLTRLGYFIGLAKSQLTPVKCLRFLGAMIKVNEQEFMLPLDKKVKFGYLREYILQRSFVDLRTLQRFVGKCISMSMMVPSAKLYTAEMIRALSRHAHAPQKIAIDGSLRVEIAHWQFVDTLETGLSGDQRNILLLQVTTDSSGYRWGGKLSVGAEKFQASDYFLGDKIGLPIW